MVNVSVVVIVSVDVTVTFPVNTINANLGQNVYVNVG